MTHLPTLISDLTLILISAAIISLLFKKLKQPVVLGYIIAGLVVGPNFNLFPTVSDPENIKAWGEFGVIILLFSLGLEFSFRKLMKVGASAGITAFSGVTFTLLTGFLIGKLMGWDTLNCLFFGGILAISSTTIIIRAYEEMQLKNAKFAQIVTGALIVEDLFAVLLMVLLSSVAVTKSFQGMEMLLSVSKLLFFLVLWFISGIFFLPSIIRRLRALLNPESLLVFSLALCFLMVYLASAVGFSSALGAFVMGSILAETTKAEKIEHILEPIKSLFGAIFFVSVGMLLDFKLIIQYWPEVLMGTMVLIFIKPTFVTIGSLISGQKLQTSIQAGMSMSQIGEFSFIIAGLGLSLQVTDAKLYPIAVAVSVLTTFTTPFMLKMSMPVVNFFEKKLPQRWLESIDRYAVGARMAGKAGSFQRLLRYYAVLGLIYSVVIISGVLISTQLLLPIVIGSLTARIVLAVGTLAILAPFIWALAFRRSKRELYAEVWQNQSQRRPLIVLMLIRMALALLYIGFLLSSMFSFKVALFGVLAALIIILVFAPKIKQLYGRIEKRFMLNLNERENGKAEGKGVLAPWDTHIGTILLNPNSLYVGKTLEETQMREHFGVNIAKIERGEEMIHVPDKNVRLYPNDILFVIGSDDQLKNFNESAESNVKSEVQDSDKINVILQNFKVPSDSPLVGKSIRDSKIRILSKGLVVGIERDGKRILNPDSLEKFKADDMVWIVGNAARIKVLLKQLGESA